MTKTIILILLTLSLAACGGEPFTEFSATPGAGGDATEAGAAGVTEGGSAAEAGSSSGAAGKPAGGSAGAAQGGHPSVGGGSSGGAAAGSAGAPVAGSSGSAGAPACELDRSKLEANLPNNFTWGGLDYKNDATCAICAGSNCMYMPVTSWGAPTEPTPGTLQYSISGGLAQIKVGSTSNGMCTKQTQQETHQCSVDLSSITLTLQVAREADHWVVTGSSARVFFQDNMCLETYAGGIVPDLNMALEQSIGSPDLGLEIPCK